MATHLASMGPEARLAGDGTVTAFSATAALGLIGGFFWSAARLGPDVWVPVLVFVALAAISVPVCIHLARGDRRLRRLLVLGLALKLLCVVPRYLVNEVTYGGNSDAAVYHEGGATLRQHALEGTWSLDGAFVEHFPSETQFVAYVAGTVYLVTGASQMAAYLVFAWLGWIGLVAVFLAFRTGYPDAPPHLAARLLFLLPSLLYWPSSLGKDALMLFGLGLLVLGTAHLLVGRRAGRGLALVAAGAYPVLSIRPHLLLIVGVGVAVSLVAANPRRSWRATASRVVLLAALVPILFLGMAHLDRTFGANGDSGFTVAGSLQRTSTLTSMGGSAFATQPIRSPLDVPVATVNVLYRPFLFQANSLPALISALEGTVLMVLTVVCARWLWRIGPEARRHPLAGFALGYALAFVFAFANVGNAGILARQRSQLFPVLMVLVAAAAEAHRLNTSAVGADRRAVRPALPELSPRSRLVPVP